MNRKLIYDILKMALSEDNADTVNSLTGVSSEDWHRIFVVLGMHGVAGLSYYAIESMPEESRPPKDVLMKFISASMNGMKNYAKLQAVSEKINSLMVENQVKCILLKGLSLAEYYPRPQSRKFLDIDLYAPGADFKVDDVFRARGIHVDTDFYRHSHVSFGGILVENHHYLLDVRGRKRLAELDEDLKSMASAYLETLSLPGLHHPDPRFSLIFNLHHAMSHFVYEGISFKFLVDWIYFLRKERELLATEQVAESLGKHGLLKFAAVMSEVSVRYLGLSLDDVPECIRKEMMQLKPRIIDRFVDDLFRPYEQIHHKSIVSERIHSVRRIIKASWKPKEFLGQSALGFVWDKFVPILMGHKFEAD